MSTNDLSWRYTRCETAGERGGGERAEVLTSIIVGGATIDTPQFGVSLLGEGEGVVMWEPKRLSDPYRFSLSLFRHLRDRRPIMRDGSTFEEGTFSWEYVDITPVLNTDRS